MIVGGILGILFVTMLRRVMVEDPELPFPESVAASRDPQGRPAGARRPRCCSSTTWDSARSIYLLGSPGIFARQQRRSCVEVGQLGKSVVRLAHRG